MTAKTKIRAEQLTRARKLLHELPQKEDRKTRPEAAKFLEDDFRKALRKGYSPKELSLLLRNAGIMIPAYLIQNCLPETTDAPGKTPVQKRENASVKAPAPVGNTFTVSGLANEKE